MVVIMNIGGQGYVEHQHWLDPVPYEFVNYHHNTINSMAPWGSEDVERVVVSVIPQLEAAIESLWGHS